MTIEAAETDQYSDLARKIGGILRQARKAKGLTLKDVADRCGTTPQTIQRLEAVTMTMSVWWIEKICNALSIHPADLFCDHRRNLTKEIETMRTEAEILKVRNIDFIGRIDAFLKATD